MNQKNRFRKNRNVRKRDTRSKLPLILIVCEGEKTEKYYFDSFRIATVDVEGTGKGAGSIINETQRLLKKSQNKEYDQIWLVFDKDNIEDLSFDKIIRDIRRKKYNAIYSNPCFELWFLLHFVFYNTPLDSKLCLEKLKNYLLDYRKNDKQTYKMLEKKTQKAISNAKKLESIHRNKKNLYNKNPYTNVYKLVERLMEYKK